jgi:hypothetical protein
MATPHAPASGIRFTVVTNANGDPTFTNTGSVHTGPGTNPQNHILTIRNKTAIRLRVCVRSNDGTPVEEDFDTPLTVSSPTDPVGFVEVPAKGPGPQRDTVLQLSDIAFATLNQYTLSVASSTVTICVFKTGDIGSTQDVIVP